MNTTFKTSMEALSPKNIPHSSVENKAKMLLSSSSSPPPPPVSSPPSQPIRNEKKTPTTHQFIPPPQTNYPPPSGDAPVSPPPPPQPMLPIKCPRCDSPDTKFCYYNNYSLNQPRHYCRTCRRHWTKGGALRNIPFGGTSKKRRSRLTATSVELLAGEDSDGPKPFQGTLSPMGFGVETTLSHFPNPNIPSPNLSPFGDHPNLNPPMGGPYILESSLNFGQVTDQYSYLRFWMTNSNMSMIGHADQSLGEKNDQIIPASNISGGGVGDGGSISRSLAPPMESLSSLHWRLLQHQKMAMLYGRELGINLNGYIKEEPEMLPLTPVEEENLPQPMLVGNIMELKSGQSLEYDPDQYNHGSTTAGNEDRGKQVYTSRWLFGGGNHGGGDGEDDDGKNNSKNGSSGGGCLGWPPDQLNQPFNGST